MLQRESRWACALAGAVLFSAAAAQTYPTRPVTLIVPYVPGGIVDLIGRLTGPELAERLGQTVVIENVGGASGTLGAAKAARARADGYTLLIGSGSEISVAKLITPNIPYDGEKDFAPITLIGSTPMVLLGGTRVKAETLAELLSSARAKPGTYAYASSGTGSPNHLAGELIKMLAGVDITHVPYKGAPPIVADTLGGQITIGAPGLPVTIPQIRAGQLRLLAVWSPARVPLFPDVPTVQEVTGDAALTGLPTWYGFLLPGGTPREIVARIEEAILGALKDAEVARRLADAGATVVAQPSAAFDASNREQTAQFAAIFQRLGMKQE